MLRTFFRMFMTLFILIPAVHAAPLKDVAGSKDHPMVSRYADSIVIGYKLDKFDEAELVLGPATYKDGKRGFEKSQMLQGQRTRLLYVAPKDRSSLEVMKNYEEALAKAGFSTPFMPARAPSAASRWPRQSTSARKTRARLPASNCPNTLSP